MVPRPRPCVGWPGWRGLAGCAVWPGCAVGAWAFWARATKTMPATTVATTAARTSDLMSTLRRDYVPALQPGASPAHPASVWSCRAAVVVLALGGARAAEPPPNVILFVPDGLRGGMVSMETAPALASLARDGVTFTQLALGLPDADDAQRGGAGDRALTPATPVSSAIRCCCRLR